LRARGGSGGGEGLGVQARARALAEWQKLTLDLPAFVDFLVEVPPRHATLHAARCPFYVACCSAQVALALPADTAHTALTGRCARSGGQRSIATACARAASQGGRTACRACVRSPVRRVAQLLLVHVLPNTAPAVNSNPVAPPPARRLFWRFHACQAHAALPSVAERACVLLLGSLALGVLPVQTCTRDRGAGLLGAAGA
jgi:hypothetical protein